MDIEEVDTNYCCWMLGSAVQYESFILKIIGPCVEVETQQTQQGYAMLKAWLRLHHCFPVLQRITTHCANMTIDDRLYITPSIVPIMIGFYSYCLPARHPSRPQCSPQRNLSHKIRSSAWELESIFGSLFNVSPQIVPTLYQFTMHYFNNAAFS
ncbi:hypothetical protein V8E54_007606 [Elaphomyces granulatus]